MEQPVQSKNDTRDYRVVTLKNKLRALLISDRLPSDGHTKKGDDGESRKEDACGSSKLAAVSLCIRVGSFQDPEDLPGLSHYLEHMVFMGSKAYPKEDGMDSFLEKHSGSTDAFTACEHTCFFFTVQHTQLRGALDQFVQFFFSPLLREEACDRELESLNSEFQLGIPKDANRVEQLFCTIARKHHPMSYFMWGNIETLRTRPTKEKIDVYKRLRAFHQKYYVGERMTLVVESNETLDNLEKLVDEKFSVIPEKSESKPSFINHGPPFETKSFNQFVKVVPVQRVHKVILSWCLESQLPNYRSKALAYLGWLLGHEGKGSVSAYLRQKQWKEQLVAGVAESELLDNSFCCLFQVSIRLSEDGFQHLMEVVATIFQYISMLRSVGPSQTMYNEIKRLKDTSFQWKKKKESIGYVRELSLSMHLYDPKDYLTGDTLFMEFNKELITTVTNSLTPEKMNLMVLSSSYEGTCEKICEWFGTSYSIEDIPDPWFRSWTDPEVNKDLYLPNLPNSFLVTDFTLKPSDFPDSEIPVLISQTTVSQVWYKRDNTFKVPHAFIFIHVTSSNIKLSAKWVCLMKLFVKLAEDTLSEATYDAQEAELSYSVEMELNGMVLEFKGYSEKIVQLFQIVTGCITDLKFTDEEFQAAVNIWKKIYYNDSLDPAKQNSDAQKSILLDKYWTKMELLSELRTISRKEFEEFMKDFLLLSKFDMLIQGNFTIQEARELERWLLDKLNANTRPPSVSSSNSESNRLVTKLPDYTVIRRIRNLKENDINCVITNVYQHGTGSIHEQQMMEMFAHPTSMPVFASIRTKGQFGYTVTCLPHALHGVISFTITIGSQSTKFSMMQLDDAIESFLCEQRRKIDQWCTEDFFKNLVQSQIAGKQEKDTNLGEEVERNWQEILEGSFLFNRNDLEIAELRKITFAEFSEFCNSHLQQSSTRRKMSVQVVGTVPVPTTVEKPEAKPAAKKKRRSGKKTTKPKKTPQRRDKDAIPKTFKDSRGNTFIKDVAAFKIKCDKYPDSHIT